MSRSFSCVPSRLLLFSPEELRSVGRGSQLRSRLLSQLQRSWELATFWRTAAGRVFRTQFFCWSYFADSFSVRRSFVRCCFAVGHRRYVSVAQTISTESECVDSPLLLLFTEKSKTNWQQHLTKRIIELFENSLSVSGLFYRQVKIVCFFDRQIADIHFDLNKSIEVSSVKTDCNLSALFESKIGVRYAIDMFWMKLSLTKIKGFCTNLLKWRCNNLQRFHSIFCRWKMMKLQASCVIFAESNSSLRKCKNVVFKIFSVPSDISVSWAYYCPKLLFSSFFNFDVKMTSFSRIDPLNFLSSRQTQFYPQLRGATSRLILTWFLLTNVNNSPAIITPRGWRIIWHYRGVESCGRSQQFVSTFQKL